MLRDTLTQLRLRGQLLAVLRGRTVSAEGYEEELRSNLARREEHFLWSIEHLVFAHPSSPYRPLLDLAGYDLPRVRQLVAAHGLDAALDQLAADGVYVRIEEFKGAEPAVRRGQTFRFQQRDFRNPRVAGAYHSRSSGSRGRGSHSLIPVPDLLEQMRRRRWALEQSGVFQRDLVLWSPSAWGSTLLTYAMIGSPPRRWFTMSAHGMRTRSIEHRLARLLGGPRLPLPELLPPDRVLDLARYIHEVNTSRGILVGTSVNAALRLVLAAEEAGIPLGDVVFRIGGEPITPHKRRQIEERGFRVLPMYGFSEFGNVGWACLAPQTSDEVHVFTDRAAVRTYPRAVHPNGATVPAFLYTSLQPHARHVMVNVESGDYGVIQERDCGCFLAQAGLRLMMHTIRSFEKLTAEGVTFLGSAAITLLEEILPHRFGGDSRHYQLVESEDERGFIRLFVLASPTLGAIDEQALRETVLHELGERQVWPHLGRMMADVWDEAATIRVLRRDPVTTTGGKVLHLHRDHGTLWKDAAVARDA